MPVEFSKHQKLELLLNRDGALSGSRLLTGVGLGLAMTATGGTAFAWTVAAVVASTALNVYAMESMKTNRKRLALEIYREEIAAVQGKTVPELTLADLDNAAAKTKEGGKGVVALEKTLELIEQKRNVAVLSQIVTTGLMVVGLGAVLAAPAVARSLLASDGVATGLVGLVAGASGIIYGELAKFVDAITNISFGMDDKKTVTRDVREISDQVGLGGRVSSTRVFGVFVEASPYLQNEIKQKYHDDYFNLTIAQKRKAVKEYDQALGLYRLTEDINTGCINPTELAFKAYGQHSGIARCTEVLDPFTGTAEQNISAARVSRAPFAEHQTRRARPKLSISMDDEAHSVFNTDDRRGLFTEKLFREQRWKDTQLG